MYDLLTGDVAGLDTADYEAQLRELAGLLLDLHCAADRSASALDPGATSLVDGRLIGIRELIPARLSNGPSYAELAARRAVPITPVRCTHSACRVVLSVQHPLPDLTTIRCTRHPFTVDPGTSGELTDPGEAKIHGAVTAQ